MSSLMDSPLTARRHSRVVPEKPLTLTLALSSKTRHPEVARRGPEHTVLEDLEQKFTCNGQSREALHTGWWRLHAQHLRRCHRALHHPPPPRERREVNATPLCFHGVWLISSDPRVAALEGSRAGIKTTATAMVTGDGARSGLSAWCGWDGGWDGELSPHR
jgi:hypothetical protein